MLGTDKWVGLVIFFGKIIVSNFFYVCTVQSFERLHPFIYVPISNFKFPHGSYKIIVDFSAVNTGNSVNHVEDWTGCD